MGNSTSKNSKIPKDAGMTAASIEKYYDAVARYRAACADAGEEEGQLLQGWNNNDGEEPDAAQTSNDADADAAETESVDGGPADLSSKIIRNAGVAPDDRVAATAHLNASLRALNEQDKSGFVHAIGSLAKLGVNVNRMAKRALNWVKERPWETATILIPLIVLTCTPGIIGAVGFTAGGIAAGKSCANVASLPSLTS